MTETDWRAIQLNEHLEEDTDELSNCCNAPIYDDEHRGLCSDCNEPCESNRDAYENAMEERADYQREMEREDD